MSVRKVVKWALVAIALIMVVKLAMMMFGGFHGGYHIPRGFGHYGMSGHHIGGPSLIWSFLSAVFWISLIAVLGSWGWKKWSASRITSSATLSTHPFPSYNHQADILDEWEKNQMNKKENE